MFKIILVIIGAMIGAGFASGREIYLFFSRFGNNGILGIILSSIIFGIIIYRTLMITKMYEITNYNKLLDRVNWKYDKLNIFMNFIVNSFLLISFFIMVAGFSGFIRQSFDIPIYISSTFFSFICYLIFKMSIKGVIGVNELLVPFLVFLIVFLGVKNIPFIFNNCSNNNWSFTTNVNYWIISSVLYASYNCIVLVPVLTGLRDYLTSRKQIIKIAVYSILILTILALIIFALLLRNLYYASQFDMPLLEISIQFGSIFKYLYSFIIISAIFTSAISTGYSFLKNVTKSKDGYDIVLIIICIIAVFVANIGFSKLVAILYPLFGVLGLVQFFLLLGKIS